MCQVSLPPRTKHRGVGAHTPSVRSHPLPVRPRRTPPDQALPLRPQRPQPPVLRRVVSEARVGQRQPSLSVLRAAASRDAAGAAARPDESLRGGNRACFCFSAFVSGSSAFTVIPIECFFFGLLAFYGFAGIWSRKFVLLDYGLRGL